MTNILQKYDWAENLNVVQSDKTNELLLNIKNYFHDRNEAQRAEFKKLIEITSKAIISYSHKNNDLKANIHTALDEDIAKIGELNKTATFGDTFPFRYNKLLDLLTQSKMYIDLNWQSIQEGETNKLLSNSNGISWEGTSMLNYMQTSMLEILSVIHESPISDLACLKENDIYQLATSPNIQSTFVTHLTNTGRNSLGKCELIHNWRWCLEIDQSLRLVFPSMGYTFGGSRFDSLYEEKHFKMHDCSSFVGEFLSLSLFTTQSLKAIIDPEIEREIMMQQGEDNFSMIQKCLKPKGNNERPEAGDVFLVNAHCGFVVEVNNELNHIKTLEFSRYMPFIDGFIEGIYVLNKDAKWIKKGKNYLEEELRTFIGKTNENTTCFPKNPASMHFFKVI